MAATLNGVFPRRFQIAAVLLFLTFCSLLLFKGLLLGYSYWSDELFSVAASLDSWTNLYQKWLLQIDVHPPLYHVLLKLWMSVFGPSEVATRLLSAIGAILTLLIFAFEALRRSEPRRFLALLLVGVSPALYFYSQETRSYGLAMMLASAVTVLALRLREDHRQDRAFPPATTGRARLVGYYVACLALSLIHYFGLIYVLVLSAINLLERRVEPRRFVTLAFIGLTLIWPCIHAFAGGLAGRSVWIKTTPLLGTLNSYLQGCMPILARGDSLGSYLALGQSSNTFYMAWALLLGLVLVGFGSMSALRTFLFDPDHSPVPFASESRYLLCSILLMLLPLSLIDVFKPVSTDRNFIVLLPTTMLLVANGLAVLLQGNRQSNADLKRLSALALALVMSLLLLKLSYGGLVSRIAIRQNWKGLAEYVRQSGICRTGCLAIGPEVDTHAFYFNHPELGPIHNLSSVMTPTAKLKKLVPDAWRLIPNFPSQPVLGFKPRAAMQLPGIMSVVKDPVCLQPNQQWPNNVFVVLPKTKLTGQEQQLGLVPCSPF
jgi:uncharacterized membrane protein